MTPTAAFPPADAFYASRRRRASDLGKPLEAVGLREQMATPPTTIQGDQLSRKFADSASHRPGASGKTGAAANAAGIAELRVLVTALAVLTIVGAVVAWWWSRAARRRFIEHSH